MPEQKYWYRKYKCYKYELCFGGHEYIVVVFWVCGKLGDGLHITM